MLITLIVECAPKIFELYNLFQKTTRQNNIDAIQKYINENDCDIKREFNMIRYCVGFGSYQMTDETLTKLCGEYDSRVQRKITGFFRYDPSSVETKKLRKDLAEAKPDQRVLLTLKFMEKEKLWDRGFCTYLWQYLFQGDLITKIEPKKDSVAVKQLTKSCGF